MLRFVTLVAVTVAFASSAPNPGVNPDTNVFEIDISPEEAQRYLNSPPFTEPQLSGRTAVLPLVRWNDPSFRSASAGPTLGHYWKNGHEIENTQDYNEEVYEASQFHGQDGLGAYAYGYKAPESAKVENRQQSGDVTGSYTFKAGDSDELIKVRYWADSEGFHQEDNLPKVVLKPVEEAEDVRQARLAHEKAWQEAAAAAAQQPDPQGEYSEKYDYESSASETQNSVASAPGQAAREGKAFPATQYNRPSQQYPQSGQQGQYGQQGPQPGAGQYGQQQGQYGQQGQGHFNQQGSGPYQPPKGQFSQQSSGQYSHHSSSSAQYGQGQGKPAAQQYHAQGQHEEPEPTGPPRGFFYSFDYPVSIIVPKNGGQSGPTNPGHPVDHDTVGVTAHSASHYG